MMANKAEQEVVDEKVVNDLVEYISRFRAMDEYANRLSIWSRGIVMIFDEERTKAGQLSSIQENIADHKAYLRQVAAGTKDQEVRMMIAASEAAAGFALEATNKAFGFSTYSAHKRKMHIVAALRAEENNILESIAPTRELLKDFLTEDEGGEDETQK